MTATDLTHYMNRKFAMNPWPKTFDVDMETYGNVAEAIIKNIISRGEFTEAAKYKILKFIVGENGGIMFKNVELIPIKDEPPVFK